MCPIILIHFLAFIEIKYLVAYLENSRQSDPVRPGEQWFFYWKTSAALWEGRIQELDSHEVMFLPLYWGFHGESREVWDFENGLPERDLLRLVRLLTQYDRRFCWVLPLTPAPFLPNGGVPAFSARTLSVSGDGVHLGAFDQELSLHKIFSFFEPKVWEAYSSFLAAFARFLSHHQVKAPIWGARFFYYQNQTKQSYLDDVSLAFEQGFSRFLKQNYPDGTDLQDPLKENHLKETFTNEVGSLFSTAAESSLAPFWQGSQDIVMLGGGPDETILRSLPGGKSQLEYTRDLFELFTRSDLPSSALLSPVEKKETFLRLLREHLGSREIDHRYRFAPHRAELGADFRPYTLLDIFGSAKSFKLSGLLSFLKTHLEWLYHHHKSLNFTPEWIDLNHHKVKVFCGEELTRTTFAQVLKLFLMGQTILLDRSHLPEGLDKKLQVFLIENNIKTQSVNYMTPTHVCELGEGKLVIFEGHKLIDNPSREKFWSHVFSYLNLVQPQMIMDKDVFSLWRIRAAESHELSYLDVRRVNLYNPTSYKKHVSIKTQKHFAFMKMIDPIKAQLKSTPEGVEVELLPNGTIALDFGHYEEG